jgi:deoxyribonuclease-4
MPRKESELGYMFEDLAFVRQRMKHREKVGICVDTSHIFAAGYDIRDLNAYLATIEEIDRHVGLRHIKAFHLSDSRFPLASQCCSHTHLGEGEIGLHAFAFIVNDARFRDTPLVLETPKDRDLKADTRNLKRLAQLEGAVTV